MVEVLQKGIRLVEQRELEDKARMKNLREAARLGIADIEAGQFRDFSSSVELRQHLDEIAQKAARQAKRSYTPKHFP